MYSIYKSWDYRGKIEDKIILTTLVRRFKVGQNDCHLPLTSIVQLCFGLRNNLLHTFVHDFSSLSSPHYFSH
jgi:hypothetical protein